MKFKSYKDLFKNEFSPEIKIMNFNWNSPDEIKQEPKIEIKKESTESEPVIETTKDLEPIDISIRDITPSKGLFFRRK